MPSKSTALPHADHEEETYDDARLAQENRSKARVDVVRAAQLLEDASDADVFLRHALASSHVAIDTFGKILGLSADVAHLLGSTVERLIGRRLLHRIAGADRTRFHRALTGLRATGAPFAIGVKLRTSNGVLRAAVLSLVAIGGPGRPSVAVLQVSAVSATDGPT